MADLAGQVYERLRVDLVEDRFPVGDLITEQALVERYGVSRTPVREAVMRLVYEGYLKKYPKKGYTIRIISEDEVLALEQVRLILECGVIDILVRSATDEQLKTLLKQPDHIDSHTNVLIEIGLAFHLNMARMTGNPHLYRTLEDVLLLLTRPSSQVQRLTVQAFRASVMSGDIIDNMHLAIAGALIARDAEEAKRLLRQDISKMLKI